MPPQAPHPPSAADHLAALGGATLIGALALQVVAPSAAQAAGGFDYTRPETVATGLAAPRGMAFLRTGLVLDALHAAQRTRGSLHGATMHTEHGGQYVSKAWAAARTAAGVRPVDGAVGSSAGAARKRHTTTVRARGTAHRSV